MVECPGDIPEELKRDLETDLKLQDTKARIRRTRKHAKRMKKDSDTEESSDDEDILEQFVSPRGKSSADKTLTLELLSNLFGNGSEGTSKPAKRQKPIAQYTDEDFKREERELNLKKLRSEVKESEARAELFERLIPLTDKLDPLLDRAGHAIELIIEEKMAQKVNHSVSINPEAVYANGPVDGSHVQF